MAYKISPSVGVARLGNSDEQFLLSPDSIGGLPYEADPNGNSTGASVVNFKDEAGQVRRQGQVFKVYEEDGVTEITLSSPNVISIEWTVHLANKKAAWYQYNELQGNLLYGIDNSYTAKEVPFRNPDTTGEARQELIVDPGPRTISGSNQAMVPLNNVGAPVDYPVSFPPPEVNNGTPITTLGDILTDVDGRLIVLGGKGNAGGDEPLTSYGGSDTWHDDISDGAVYCTITFDNPANVVELQAWVIVGSPDFVPEIVNISNLSDSMFDVGVREFNLVNEAVGLVFRTISFFLAFYM